MSEEKKHLDRLARYNELAAKEEEDPEGLTDLETEESVQLFYELHPDEQYWRDQQPDMTPENFFHAKEIKKKRGNT